MTIELCLALKAFNLVTKFEKKRLTFVAIIVWKRSVTDRRTDRQTDRQTDGQTQINNPPFLFEKAGIKNKMNTRIYFPTYKLNKETHI